MCYTHTHSPFSLGLDFFGNQWGAGEFCKAAAVSLTSFFYPDIYGNFIFSCLVSQFVGGSIFGSSSTCNFVTKFHFCFSFVGGNGLVCEGERTCCPANVESALRHSAASDFHHAVRQSSHQLRHTLTQSSTAIQGENPNSIGGWKKKQTKQTCLHENIFIQEEILFWFCLTCRPKTAALGSLSAFGYLYISRNREHDVARGIATRW